jgi:hypothetical protein|tara:strand:- start:138 stop:266 length:129 start_codon:yes stop_codon:yes gene_type:complete
MKKLIGIENDGYKTRVIYIDNGNYVSEDLKVGITTIDDLVES